MRNMPTTQAEINEMNGALAQWPVKKFKPCGRGSCVDGWVVIPPKPGDKNVKVTRCQCFLEFYGKTA